MAYCKVERSKRGLCGENAKHKPFSNTYRKMGIQNNNGTFAIVGHVDAQVSQSGVVKPKPGTCESA
jgi:hypothetical protein